MGYPRKFVVILFLAVVPGFLASQSVQNPDISIVPRFQMDADNDGGGRTLFGLGSPRFFMKEFEMALQGYLNPYARADIFLTKGGLHDEPIELEEIYATFLRGLPLDMNVRAGKYRVEFGKLNSTHPHAWPFITNPSVLERFFGEEGLNDLGISVSFLLPTGDMYTRWSFDLLDGGTIPSVEPINIAAGGIGLKDTSGGLPRAAYSTRLMSFFPVGEESDLEVGVSVLTGVHDPYAGKRFIYGGLDFKYKWKPDGYSALTVQGEAMLNKRSIAPNASLGTISVGELTSFGLFLFADYQFLKVFSVGLRYDWAESPYRIDDRISGTSIFFGFYPVEETMAFRLQLQRTTNHLSSTESNINAVALQFLFSLGPHKAHPF